MLIKTEIDSMLIKKITLLLCYNYDLRKHDIFLMGQKQRRPVVAFISALQV